MLLELSVIAHLYNIYTKLTSRSSLACFQLALNISTILWIFMNSSTFRQPLTIFSVNEWFIELDYFIPNPPRSKTFVFYFLVVFLVEEKFLIFLNSESFWGRHPNSPHCFENRSPRLILERKWFETILKMFLTRTRLVQVFLVQIHQSDLEVEGLELRILYSPSNNYLSWELV